MDIVVFSDKTGLDALANTIRNEYQALGEAARNLTRRAYFLGEALLAAREQVLNGKTRGDWIAWFEIQGFEFAYSSATNFMRVAERYRGRVDEIDSIPLSMLYQLPPAVIHDLPPLLLSRVQSDDLSVKAAIGLARALHRASPDVIALSIRYEVSDPGIVPMLEQVRAADPGLFEEWVTTGAIDNGEISIPLKDCNARDVEDAISKFRWYMDPRPGKLWNGDGVIDSAGLGRLLVSNIEDTESLAALKGQPVSVYIYTRKENK